MAEVNAFSVCPSPVEACLNAVANPLFNRVVKPSDPPAVAQYKRTTCFTWLFCLALSIVGAVSYGPGTFQSLWPFMAFFASTTLPLACLCYGLVTREGPKWLAAVWALATTLVIILPLDMHRTRLMTGRAWYLVTPVLDVCLLCRLPTRVPVITIAITTLWLIVSQAFLVYDARFFHDPLAASADDYEIPSICDCEHPPCSKGSLGVGVSQLLSPLFVLLLDFYLTRQFARSAEHEQNVMQASIDTAESIATLLSEFDLESAQRILDEQRSLASMPPQLRSAFGLILHNLREYKPYLPKGLFDDSGSTADAGPCSNTPPGEGEANPRAGVVFTDIKGSTALWEECADSMADAIQIHNRVIRDCIRAHGGYEVKTMGDSFMVAFTTALGAVRFGLDVQKGLHEAEWPEALAEHSDGLHVRVGANYGPVTMEWNQLTERMDYLGPTVNRASRLEGCGVPGRVAVLEDMYESEGVEKVLCGVVSSHLGVCELKGAGAHSVMILSYEDMTHCETLSFRVRDDNSTSTSSSSFTSAHSNRVMLSMGPHSGRLDLVSPTKCTVGQIQLQMSDFSEQGWRKCKERFAALSMWLRRTDGAVASVSGLSILATWGLLKRTSMHAMKAFRFAGLVQQHVPKLSDGAVTCGLSTGLVSGCHVGDWEARFLAYGGRCLSICWALCALAQRLRADVLYATEAEGVDPAVLRPLRPVGRVEVAMDGREITAYEVCGQKADRLYFDADNEGEREWGWSRSYAALFHAGDAASIRERADASCDTVLLHACNLIEMRVEKCGESGEDLLD